MIKVTVFYPTTAGARFDQPYYLNNHIPLVARRLSPALKSFHVDTGLSGGTPGTEPSFVAIANLNFESVESFQAAFAPHAQEILGDIPNYTSIQPTLQISSVDATG